MSPTGKIYISKQVKERLGIPDIEVIQVRAGVKSVNSRLLVRSNPKVLRSFMFSPELKRALCIKRRKGLQIRYDAAGGYLHIGPTIGILTSHLPNREEYSPTSLQAELMCLSKLGRNIAAQIYIFTPACVNWNTCTTRGYNYRFINDTQGIWVSGLYPLPDVVYDRIPSRQSEARGNIQAFKKRLKSLPYLKYFNPSFLNKWKVHQLLIRNPALWPYLPETQILNPENMEAMLLRYSTLYLKPANGSLGNGIIQVHADKKGTLFYTVYKGGRWHGKADNVRELLKKTRKARAGRNYIVQQGLSLAKYNKSPFDFRIIYQKNRIGEWQISKKFVRVAPHGSSVANLSRGGSAESSKRVLAKLLHANREKIEAVNQEIRELCSLVAETLERESQALYGELGLDIGIDQEGKLWLIEVNSKPRKTTETELSMGIVRNTFRRPLEYSVYLAGFSGNRE